MDIENSCLFGMGKGQAEEMMQNLKLSIIVPVYKAEAHLDSCVSSIVSQSYTTLEIILVDDGSPDRSGEMCDAWAARDSRIIVIHKENGGISSARNAGLAATTGEWIGFADDDDIVPVGAYEALMAKTSGEKVGMVSGMFEKVDNGVAAPWKWYNFDDKTTIASDDIFYYFINRTYNVENWNRIYKASLIGDARFPIGKMAEDVYFNCLFAINMQNEGYYAAETSAVVYQYIQSETQISKQQNARMWLDWEKHRLMMALKYCRTFPKAEDAQQILYTAWHETLYVMNRFSLKGENKWKQPKLISDWKRFISSLTWDDFLLLKKNRVSHYLQFAVQKYCPRLNSTLQFFINAKHKLIK